MNFFELYYIYIKRINMKVNWEKEKNFLINLINDNIPYEAIGRKYGVTGNAVKKAAKKLGIKLLPRRKIKKYFDKKNMSKFSDDKYKIEDLEPYVLERGEKVSIIKYPNSRGKRMIRKCKYCGNIFETLVIKVRNKGEHFCSKECYINFMKKNAMSDDEKRIKEVFYQKKSKYGLSEKEYNELFNIQKNKCAICGCEFNENNKAFVDHSHITNKVRGLLCTKCNTLLGMSNDNVAILEKAIEYLKNR